MTQVFPPQETKTSDHNSQDGQEKDKGMTALAGKEIEFHTRPLPEAEAPSFDPFPTRLWRGLLAGLFAGSVLGLLFGALLFQNVLVIPGWESLFSMGPFTFHFFWLVIGSAVGASITGIALIMLAPASQH